MESQFRNAEITTDQTKYDHVVGSLDSATLRYIADIVRAPPVVEKYEAVKKPLIQDFADSENRKLRRLVQKCQLDNSKPTHLLRTMRDLASGAMNDGAIKQLWLDRLPEAVRAVVSISEADLDKCAQQADLMLEMGNYNSVAVINTSAQNNDHIMKAIDALSKQIAEIKTAQRRSRTRSQTPDRKRRHSTRTDSQVKRYPMCYYHYRFGVETKKCSLPCSFNQQGNQ
ncbi:uncharacterized protein LOC119675219 [Teleopsis dalmanni]|uniref:uncharacterized protein LOC119675217 n=1 Tax=Teleopsis dalmanni TaxID=139649 RepID=UPI0018CE83DE|nr:uncharacterized protein LOC119675217 [Teleopsis dalmanni]XP_037942335.1 uncharacterized protein LOC119675219 [Teleopsis dalmanni]